MLVEGRWRNGRRCGLKIRSGVTRVWVRIPPALQGALNNGLRYADGVRLLAPFVCGS